MNGAARWRAMRWRAALGVALGAALGAVMLIAAPSSHAQDSLRVSQADAQLPRLTVYADLLGSDGRPHLPAPAADRLTARVAGRSAWSVGRMVKSMYDPTWTAGRDFAIENGRNAGG